MKYPALIFHCSVLLVIYSGWLVRFVSTLGSVCQSDGENGTAVVYNACDVGVQYLTRTSRYNISVIPAGSTCGTPESSYCARLDARGQDCVQYDNCISAVQGKEHPTSYMTDGVDTTWWQSINWPYSVPKESTFPVTVQLSFGKLYELTNDINIIFRWGRPFDMVLEKSVNYGQTWMALQYYSHDCSQLQYSSVAGVSITQTNPTAVICTEEYSGKQPQSGLLKFAVSRDRYEPWMGPSLTNYEDLYNALETLGISQFLSFTDLRLRLLKPAVDARFLFADETYYYNYYYAISELVISGRCDCNLHGSTCDVVAGETICQCEHNTQGKYCEECMPLYNERAWLRGSYLPYDEGTANECVKCTCNDHADSCRFQAGDGGICVNCTHNTHGFYCQECVDRFFPNTSVPINDPNYCIDCNCEPLGVAIPQQTTCTKTAIGFNPIGQCLCKMQVTGRRCDRCIDSFYGLLLDDRPGECKECGCNLYGKIGPSNICEQTTGQCPCKSSTTGRQCDQCKDSYYDFPSGISLLLECDSCDCNWGGAISRVCDKSSGQCVCQQNIDGRKCDAVKSSYYFPLLDSNVYESSGGTCTEFTAMRTEQFPFDGQGFVRCPKPIFGVMGESYIEFEISGHMIQPKLEWPYNFAVRYTHNSVYEWSSSTLTVTVLGNVDNIDLEAYQRKQVETIVGTTCPQAIGANPRSLQVSFTPGAGHAWISGEDEAFTLDARCRYSLRLDIGQAHDNETSTDIMIDSLVVVPSLIPYEGYQQADNSTKALITHCTNDVLPLSTKNAALNRDECRRLTFWVGTQINSGVLACDCDPVGTVAGNVCEGYGGQCQCKSGVSGRNCGVCEPGYFNFTDTGCTACDCDSLGSKHGVCNVANGQCPCRQNVGQLGETNTGGALAGRKCQACKVDHYGFQSGDGCIACSCNPEGSMAKQCNINSGQCPCKDTITGPQCGGCQASYFGFHAAGCSLCNCTSAGVTSPNCDQLSGACDCRLNVEGDKCDQCKVGFYNLDANHPDGCQPCFCYGHGVSCSSAPNYVEKLITADNAQSWEAAPLSGYVQAPPEFLGNMMHAYGQTLSLSVMALSASVSLADYRPIILQGNGKQIFFTDDQSISSLQYLPIEVLIRESQWYTNATYRPTPLELYEVLASLDAIYIQQNYGIVVVNIRDISLRTATEAGEGTTLPEVTYVESCTCDPNAHVSGMSCGSCEQGHHRSVAPISNYDTCIPCNCNGKQDGDLMCDEDSGICLNCRNATMGDHCEACADHVIPSTECNACDLNYWGLFAVGCIACNCSLIGSSGLACHMTTGKCICKNHVTGQQCDICEDNYFNLSNAGCKVCNDCYTLVQAEGNKLQGMKDNLTNYVDTLRANDDTSVLGLFTGRLQKTLTEMQNLLQFLADSKTVEVSVAQKVSQLNDTLNGLMGNLENDAARVLDDTDSSLADTGGMLTDAKALRDRVNATMYSTLAILQGPFQQAGVQIDSLVRSLNEAFQKYNQVAGSTQQDMNRLTQEVTSIELITEYTLNVSRKAAETAKGALDNHGVMTTRITQLETFLITVGVQLTSIKSQAEVTLEEVVQEGTDVNDVSQGANELGRQVEGGVLQPYVFSVAQQTAYQIKAGELKASAVNLNTEANSAAQDDVIAGRVRGAADQSTALLATSKDRLGQSEALLSQALSASYTANNASSLEASTFKDAQDMLTTMSNFDTIKADLEAKTSEALATVQQVEARSRVAIETADGIHTDLQQPFADSQEALGSITTAKQLQQAKLDQIIPVGNHANRLQSEASLVLNNLDQEEARVGTANNTINLGDQTCQNMQVNLAAIKNKSTTANTRAEEAVQVTTTTKDQAEKLLNSLKSVQELDVVKINELKKNIFALREDFDNRQLAAVIGGLRDLINRQQEWIVQAEKRKDKLKSDKAMLEVTQSLLVNNRGVLLTPE